MTAAPQSIQPMTERPQMHDWGDACEYMEKLEARIQELEGALDAKEEALHKIDSWSRAYPLRVFPEPDLKKARELLEAGGITLDAVSASCMRHCVEGVGKIARGALEAKS